MKCSDLLQENLLYRRYGLDAAAIIGIVGTAVAVVGTGITVYSSIQQQEAANETAKAEARAREMEAQSAREAAAYEETQFRRRASLLLGKQRAIAAASGVDVSTGSPLLAELDTIQQTELEALNIRRTGAVSASSKEFEARLSNLRGAYARGSIPFLAAGGALKAGSSILGGWYSYNKASKSMYPEWMYSV